MINYPNKKVQFNKQKTNHSNRGMSFEKMINESNEYYLAHNIAMIHKKPIPVQIVKVDYPSRTGAVIKEAYYKVPSTTDYNGLYKGIHIDFEAKETLNKTSFPLSNIHAHQIEHLSNIRTHGGISFLLIFFKTLDEIYLIESSFVDQYAKRAITGRKSIHIDEIRENGYLVTESITPRVKYLDVVNIIIEKAKSNWFSFYFCYLNVLPGFTTLSNTLAVG